MTDCRIIRRPYNKFKDWLVLELYKDTKILNIVYAFTYPDRKKKVTKIEKGVPVQKYITLPATIYVPESVTKGLIDTDDSGRMDLIVNDKYGFRVIYEGINRFSNRVKRIYINQYGTV